jgi:hypothetical protein
MPEHVHAFELWATFHRAPTGPPPEHTSFVVFTCAACGALITFPETNFARCTPAFKAQFTAVFHAAGWQR